MDAITGDDDAANTAVKQEILQAAVAKFEAPGVTHNYNTSISRKSNRRRTFTRALIGTALGESTKTAEDILTAVSAVLSDDAANTAVKQEILQAAMIASLKPWR